MSVVKINVLTVPATMREELERRFAGRAGMVEAADGFEWFELLRPVEGTERYLVYTRWRNEQDFQRWQESQAFGQGHAHAVARKIGGCSRNRRLPTVSQPVATGPAAADAVQRTSTMM